MIVVKDISKVKCYINTVLVRPNKSNDEVLLNGDKAFYIDTTFEPYKHTPVVGVVAAVPSQLYFTPKDTFYNSMDWDTDMELEVGDVVNYHYLDMKTAIDQDDYVVCDGKIYVPIRYDRIFCARRKFPKGPKMIQAGGNFVVGEDGPEQVIMLNGYVLAEPVTEKVKTFLKLPDSVKDRHDAKFGKVRFIGTPNRRYRENYAPDDARLEIGDLVILDKICDIALEYDVHAQFDGGKKYFRVERRTIKGVITN